MNSREKLVLSGGIANSKLFGTAFELSQKDAPNLLVDLSALPTPEMYQEKRAIYAQYFRKMFGMRASFLQDTHGDMRSQRVTNRLIGEADVLYISGGSTRKLLNDWRAHNLTDKVADKVTAGDLVGTGTSAGSLAWFQTAHSDSRQYERHAYSWRYVLLPALGIIDSWATVHHHDHDSMGRLRSQAFSGTLRGPSAGKWEQAVGIDTSAALVCTDGIARVLELKPKQRVFDPDPTISLYTPGIIKPAEFHDGDIVPLA